jgi:hypothetical protein
MSWNASTIKALERWLAPETSYKEHPIDDARFYSFIAQLWSERPGLWDEGLAREEMTSTAKRLHPEWPDDLISEFVEDRKEQGTLILDFLSSLRDQGEVLSIDTRIRA